MRVTSQRILACPNGDPLACSEGLLTRLGHRPAFSLKADAPTDRVHGSLTVTHASPPTPHEITVEVYEADETQNYDPLTKTGHRTHLKRPIPFPTEQEIRMRLDHP